MKEKINREQLRFQETVKGNFNFLTIEYNFMLADSDLYHVRYHSYKVDFSIYHERLSYEIYFVISLCKKIENKLLSIGISDLLPDSYEKVSYYPFHCCNIKSVEESIKVIAKIIKDNAYEALVGNEDYYIAKFKENKSLQEELILENNLKIMEKDALLAWRNQDYKTVINLYDKYKEYLSESQRKKLQYCLKKIKAT